MGSLVAAYGLRDTRRRTKHCQKQTHINRVLLVPLLSKHLAVANCPKSQQAVLESADAKPAGVVAVAGPLTGRSSALKRPCGWPGREGDNKPPVK